MLSGVVWVRRPGGAWESVAWWNMGKAWHGGAWESVAWQSMGKRGLAEHGKA